MNIKDRKVIALIVAFIYIVFLVFVFLIPDLRTDKFVRGITGLLTALFIAIEIFILIPPPKDIRVPIALAIKVPVALASAAVFYYFLLPQILPFVFPDEDDTKIVRGTVYSKEKNQRLDNATIGIQQTDLKTSTNADGTFTITKVPKDKNKLTINYGGVEREFDIDESEKYYFEQILIEKTPVQKLDSTVWKEGDGKRCNKYNKSGYEAVQLFMLQKDRIPIVEGYDKLYVKVEYLGKGDVIFLDYTENMSQIGTENNPVLWWLPVENENLKFSSGFCVGLKKGYKIATVYDWNVSFWFQKEK